jgi:hypothetical protein
LDEFNQKGAVSLGWLNSIRNHTPLIDFELVEGLAWTQPNQVQMATTNIELDGQSYFPFLEMNIINVRLCIFQKINIRTV